MRRRLSSSGSPEIRLKGLGRKAGERLVRQVLGDSGAPGTIEHLVKQADGNAFYLEELIRAAAEGKDPALPDTVLAMVEARLGRLAVEARRVLRAASVFGEVCWEGSVVVLLSRAMSATMVGEWLAKLVEQEVLVVRPESRFAGEREFKFRHALLREGVYATLAEEDKRLGHRLAGEWLEQHGEGDPMVLAGHFERGAESARAAAYYLRASEQAFHILDLKATVARAGLGLSCAPPPELRIALLGILCDASGQGLHLSSAVMPNAEELMRSAPPGSVPWAQAINVYIEGMMVAGRIGDLVATIAQLGEVTPAPGAAGRMALAFLSGISVLDGLGRIPEGTVPEARFFAVVRPTEDQDLFARFWWNLATLSALRLAQGRTDEALAAAEDAMARCTTMGGCGLFRGAFVRLAHAEALHATGAHDAARRAITEARAQLLCIAAKIGDPAYRQSFLDDVPENARTLSLASAWIPGLAST